MRIIIVALLFAALNLEGQRLVLESKAGFSISTHIAFPVGKPETSKGSFVFPSLLSNFKQGYGLNIEYYTQFNPRLNMGICYSNTIFHDWQFDPSSEAFNNAEAFIHSLSLNVAVKSLFHERGLLNKTKFYVGLAPGAYLVAVKTPEQSISSSNDVRPGLLTNGSIEYAIRNNIAISISGGYQIVSVDSSIYQEKMFQWFQASVGVTFRLNRNQNYLRSIYE